MGSRSASLLFVLIMGGAVARAQGCSQCRDNVAQSNPAVQASYREAISFMLGAVVGVSTAMVVVMCRLR